MDKPAPANADDPLFTLLYVSELAAGGAVEIDQICRQSVANNQRDAVTGVLVFDGQGFCQFVEGPEAAVTGLFDRLERDPRHRKMKVLQLGRVLSTRRFASWRLGYAYSADPAAIARIGGMRGDEALVAFGDWVPGLNAREETESQ